MSVKAGCDHTWHKIVNHISTDVTHLSVPWEVREWAFQHPKEAVQVTNYKISWVHWGVPFNSGDDIVGCTHAWLLLTPWDRKASICNHEEWIWKVKCVCTSSLNLSSHLPSQFLNAAFQHSSFFHFSGSCSAFLWWLFHLPLSVCFEGRQACCEVRKEQCIIYPLSFNEYAQHLSNFTSFMAATRRQLLYTNCCLSENIQIIKHVYHKASSLVASLSSRVIDRPVRQSTSVSEMTSAQEEVLANVLASFLFHLIWYKGKWKKRFSKIIHTAKWIYSSMIWILHAPTDNTR